MLNIYKVVKYMYIWYHVYFGASAFAYVKKKAWFYTN